MVGWKFGQQRCVYAARAVMTRRMRPIKAALVLHVQTPVSERRAKALSLLAVCITTCQRLSVPRLGTLDEGRFWVTPVQ